MGVEWRTRTWSNIPCQRSDCETPSVHERVMFPNPTGVVRGVVTQRRRQQPFQRGAPSEMEKHESSEVHGAHSSREIVRQRSQVEGQEERGDRHRELFQPVLRCEGVHLYSGRGSFGKHQIVQRPALRSICGERVAVLDDGRDTTRDILCTR